MGLLESASDPVPAPNLSEGGSTAFPGPHVGTTHVEQANDPSLDLLC